MRNNFHGNFLGTRTSGECERKVGTQTGGPPKYLMLKIGVIGKH